MHTNSTQWHGAGHASAQRPAVLRAEPLALCAEESGAQTLNFALVHAPLLLPDAVLGFL